MSNFDSDSEYDSERSRHGASTSSARVATEQPTGLSCQTMHFESIYNFKGERVLLRAGSKELNQLSSHDESCRHAALVTTKYRSPDHTAGYTELKIQSPFIKTAMKKLIPEFEHFNIDIQHIIIRDEPKCLFYYRYELMEYRKSCYQRNEPQAAQHIQYLIDYMFNVLMVEASAFRYQVENTSQEPGLDFNHLWMAFAPGELIYTKRRDLDQTIAGQLFRLVSMERHPGTLYESVHWSLQGHYIDYDGSEFGHREMKVTLRHYDGVSKLCDLEAVPLKYHREKDLIHQKFLDRGKKFVTFQSYKYKSYKGPAVNYSSWNGLQHVDSRVLIDRQAYVEHGPGDNSSFVARKSKFKPDDAGLVNMSDEEYLICSEYALGYSLDDKAWCKFHIELITDVQFSQGAFQSLLLDPSQKQMILSLLLTHRHDDDVFDDFIQGKGKGLTILLHGPPGTGKTLTAEGIADHTSRPLMKIDSGELGLASDEVESSLLDIFKLATKWKAVVLLDEADIFLHRRTESNIQLNSLVSVFLRLLEYYKGILFLTTNRVSTFDPAFKSRIHLAIHYSALTKANRETLWGSILSHAVVKGMTHTVTESQISTLDDEGLNGRQVKNVVRIAYTLALSEERPLNVNDLSTALKTMRDFDHDFEGAQDPKTNQQALGGSQENSDDPQHQITRKRALSTTNDAESNPDDADDATHGSHVKKSRVV